MRTRVVSASVVLVVAVLLSGATETSAAIVSSASKQSTVYPVSNTDLLQTGFGSVTALNIEANTAEPIARDGVFNTGDPANDRVTAGGGRYIEYELNVATNPGGYDITGIDTYGYWNNAASGGRSSQAYKVSVAFVGSPTTFVQLLPNTDWTSSLLPTAGLMTEVTHVNGSGGVLDNGSVAATGVQRIRFDFGNAAPLGVNMYRELDVIGAPTGGWSTTPVLPNGSFELPDLNNGPGSDPEFYTTEIITGWKSSGAYNEGVLDPAPTRYVQDGTTGEILDPGSEADGDQFGFVNTSNSTAGLTSSAVAMVEANALYTLDVALGKGMDSTAGLTGQYSIGFLVDGVPVGTPTIVDASLINPGDFVDFSNTFQATSGGGLLQVQLSFTGNGQAHFDNVRVQAELQPQGDIPEPVTLTLFGLALGGLGLRIRRRFA